MSMLLALFVDLQYYKALINSIGGKCH